MAHESSMCLHDIKRGTVHLVQVEIWCARLQGYHGTVGEMLLLAGGGGRGALLEFS